VFPIALSGKVRWTTRRRDEYADVCISDDVVLLYRYILSARVAAEIITRDVLRGGERFHRNAYRTVWYLTTSLSYF